MEVLGLPSWIVGNVKGSYIFASDMAANKPRIVLQGVYVNFEPCPELLRGGHKGGLNVESQTISFRRTPHPVIVLSLIVTITGWGVRLNYHPYCRIVSPE